MTRCARRAIRYNDSDKCLRVSISFEREIRVIRRIFFSLHSKITDAHVSWISSVEGDPREDFFTRWVNERQDAGALSSSKALIDRCQRDSYSSVTCSRLVLALSFLSLSLIVKRTRTRTESFFAQRVFTLDQSISLSSSRWTLVVAVGRGVVGCWAWDLRFSCKRFLDSASVSCSWARSIKSWLGWILTNCKGSLLHLFTFNTPLKCRVGIVVFVAVEANSSIDCERPWR